MFENLRADFVPVFSLGFSAAALSGFGVAESSPVAP